MWNNCQRKSCSDPFRSDRHTSGDAAASHLPHHQAVAVDVGHDVGLEVVLVHGLVQDLRGHIPPRAHACVQRDVHLIGVTITTYHNIALDSTGSAIGDLWQWLTKRSPRVENHFWFGFEVGKVVAKEPSWTWVMVVPFFMGDFNKAYMWSQISQINCSSCVVAKDGAI